MDRNCSPSIVSAITEKALDSDEAIYTRYYSSGLMNAMEKYQETFDRLETSQAKNDLDEDLGCYLEEHAAFFCALGVKWGMRVLLELIMEGGKKIANDL